MHAGAKNATLGQFLWQEIGFFLDYIMAHSNAIELKLIGLDKFMVVNLNPLTMKICLLYMSN